MHADLIGRRAERMRQAVRVAAVLAIVAATVVIPRAAADAQPRSCGGLLVTIDMSRNGGDGTGTNGDDVIYGTQGRDVINAGAGNDTICAAGGRDSVSGGPGNDLIYGGGDHDLLLGGPGNDTIYGQPGADNIRGEAGNDRLLGGTGYDTMNGGDGDDFIQGSGGNDKLWGGPGNDSLYGKAGDDDIYGESGDDDLYAAGGDDLLVGGPGRDRLQGANGQDDLDGGPGDDLLFGQAGDDTLQGGDGNDELYAAAGNDFLYGNTGNDRLQGANGNDFLYGEAGDDLLYGQAGIDVVDGGTGTDECYDDRPPSNCEPVPLSLAGQVVRVLGPERSADDWNAIDAAMVPFELQTGASVIYTGSADWEAELNAQVAAGNPPDISIFPQPNTLTAFARAGSIQPLTGDGYTVATTNWRNDHLQAGLVNGQFYGMPVRADLKSLVWHKPAVFAANGYAIPQTWDQLVALTNTMISDGITPWCVGIGSGQATGWVFTDWVEDRVLDALGPVGYDRWVTNDLKFNSPEIKTALREVLDLWNTPGAVFGTSASIGSTHFAIGPANGLAANDCAMVRQASFFHLFYDGDLSELDVFVLPSNSPGTRAVGAANHAAAFNNREATQALLAYVGSSTYADARQTAQRDNVGGGISGFATGNLHANTALWSPIGQRVVTSLQQTMVFRSDGSDLMPARVGAGEFWVQSTAMVNGTTSVDAAAAAIDAAWPR